MFCMAIWTKWMVWPFRLMAEALRAGAETVRSFYGRSIRRLGPLLIEH